MKECYVGESFPQRFTIYHDTDRELRVDSGTFEVWCEGEIVQSGALSIDQSGHEVSFRFTSDRPGVHEIKLTWRMGDDVWRQPFLMKVSEL